MLHVKYPMHMLAALTPPSTDLSDAVGLVAFSIPAALASHAIKAVVINRKARKAGLVSGHSSTGGLKPADGRRGSHWTGLSLFLTWLPFLVMTLGYVGCSLLRDAGFQIYPWPLLSVPVLFGLTVGLCEFVRRRTIRERASLG